MARTASTVSLRTATASLPLARPRALRGGAALPGWLADLRWPLLFSLVVAVLIEVPQRLAASGIGGVRFGGMFWGLNDPPQYYAAMRQGTASASWLIVDRFTQEPHSPALLYPLYVGLGKLGWLLGLDAEPMFLLASTAGRLFLLLAVWYATRLVSDDVRVRRAGFVMVALAGGLASVAALLARLTGLPLLLESRELNDPELNTFLVLFTTPHLMFGLGLLLVAARLYADSWTEPGAWRWIALPATVLLLGLANPFTLVPLCAVVVAHAAAMTALHRRLNRRGIGTFALTLGAAAPLVLANLLTFTLDPFWSATYGRQNVTPVPPLADLILAFGLIVPLAALGIPGLIRPLTPGRLLILAWIPLALLLMQAPTGIQRRFGIGLHPMLGLLASYGALRLWTIMHRPPNCAVRLTRPVLLAGLAQALFGSSAFTLLVAWTIGLAPLMGWLTPPIPGADRTNYQPPEVVAAGDWLAQHESAQEVVLGAVLTGNYLAGMAPGRVYVGHWVGTLDYGPKVERADWFFSGPLDAERRAFLAEHGIRYVVYGPHERALGAQAREGDGLARVYAAPGIDIFRVGTAHE